MGLFGSKSGKISLLQKVPLFEGLSQNQLKQIAQLLDEVDLPAGKRLATRGEIGHELFVIVDGQALVRIPTGRTRRLGPSEVVGEMSLIDGGPRSATVEAATPMRVLVLGHREFWQLLDVAPSIAYKIMRTLSSRLRDAEDSPNYLTTFSLKGAS